MDLALDSIETPVLTKAQLCERLFDSIGLSKRESNEMIEVFFSLITQKLISGEEVKLTSFGNFQIREKAARPGLNPRTGERVAIDARRVVTFHASAKLKEQVQA